MHLRMGLSENTDIYAYICMHKVKFTKLFKVVEFFFLIIKIASSDILFIVIYTQKNNDYDLI